MAVGTATGTTINGGFEIVSAGGTTSGTIISRGGTEDVDSGGTASTTTIYAGGFEVVSVGGFDRGGTQISGGEQDVYGAASNVLVETGSQVVEAGGIASATGIFAGGLEYVSSGGTAIDTTIEGGILEVARGGSTGSKPISFTAAGGDLQLDASQSFVGLIAGFGSPPGVTEEIDLRDIAFDKNTHVKFKEAKDGLSGTLTVREGSNVATLTLLGQYTTADFTLSSDGHGGTLITDPSGSATSPVLAAQHQ
jgi:autotransporter passenger strand-loop-strand repeat protein